MTVGDEVADDPTWSFFLSGACHQPSPVHRVRSRAACGELEASVAALAAGEAMLVLVDRRCARTLLANLRHPTRWLQLPSLSQVQSLLRSSGLQVERSLLVWPELAHRRLLAPASSGRSWAWAQRSGVAGGGGDREWARRLLSSPVVTPFIRSLCGGAAILVRRPA